MIDANRRCLAQGIALLTTLTDDQFACPRGAWSPVGAQYRHVLEHYQCLLEGVAGGRVDYDARRRDVTLEQSRTRALEVTADLEQGLAQLIGRPASLALEVQLRCDVDRGDCWTASTLGRELQFLVSHSVHHYALIKLLLANDTIELDQEFGTAPSTLSHLRAAR
ncbi:MAG: DinB family protein [Gemmatimonadales bacterium]